MGVEIGGRWVEMGGGRWMEMRGWRYGGGWVEMVGGDSGQVGGDGWWR